MKTRKLNQQTKLAIICDKLYQETNQFLESYQDKNCLSCLTHWQSKEEKIASSLQDVINKVTARMSFPQLGFFEENQFMENINHCYKALSILFLQNVNHKQKMDSRFYIYFSALQSCLKDIVRLFCPHIREVDLRYVDEYIERRELGLLERDDLINVPLFESDSPVRALAVGLMKKKQMDCTTTRHFSLFRPLGLDKRLTIKPANDAVYRMKK